MTKITLFTLMISSVLYGILHVQPILAAEEVQNVHESQFDFSVPAFDLWHGTELEPMQLPKLDVLSASVDLNATTSPSQQTLHEQELKPKNEHSKTLSQGLRFRESVPEFGAVAKGSSSEKRLAFAEPIDFELWKLAKWTLVVLIIAGTATYVMRWKQIPTLTNSSGNALQLIESVTIDVRTKVHLLSVGTEQYLVATDLNGVKSMTLIPSWNIETSSPETTDNHSVE